MRKLWESRERGREKFNQERERHTSWRKIWTASRSITPARNIKVTFSERKVPRARKRALKSRNETGLIIHLCSKGLAGIFRPLLGEPWRDLWKQAGEKRPIKESNIALPPSLPSHPWRPQKRPRNWPFSFLFSLYLSIPLVSHFLGSDRRRRYTRIVLREFLSRPSSCELRSLQVSNSMVGFYFIVMVALLKQWCLFVG